MATDRELITACVEILAALGEHGRSLDRLTSDVMIRFVRTVLVGQVEEALQFARHRGWVEDRLDDFGEQQWCITKRGLRASEDF